MIRLNDLSSLVKMFCKAGFALLLGFNSAASSDLLDCIVRDFSICSMEISPHSMQMAFDTGRDLHLLNLLNGESRRIHFGRFSEITNIRYSPDGKTLFAGKSNRKNAIYSVPQGKLRQIIETQSVTTDARFIPQTDEIVLAFWNGRVEVWNFSKNKKLYSIQAHMFGAIRLDVSENGENLITVGEDQTVRLWKLKGLKFVRYFVDGRFGIKANKAMMRDVAFVTGGLGVLVASWLPYCGPALAGLQLFNLNNGSIQHQLRDSSGCGVRVFSAARNSKWVVFRDGENGTSLMNLKTWKIRKMYMIKNSSSAAISDEGDFVVVAESRANRKSVNIRFFDLETLQELGVVELSLGGFRGARETTESKDELTVFRSAIKNIMRRRVKKTQKDY